MKELLLIDANSLIHRSFHALPPLTTPKGKPINAIYGLSSILLKILREHSADYVAAAFDRPEPTFREEIYKDYKANRPPAVDELVYQIIKAHEVFEKFGIKVIEKPGFEADDIIGTLSEKFKNDSVLEDGKIIIFSGDKDNLQLIDRDKVVVELLKTGVSKTLIYNEGLFLQNYGFEPSKLVDYKALVGDASDNIPGVAGVGPKGATDLIKKFGSLEKIYEDIELIPKENLKIKLKNSEKNAFMSKELATMKKNMDLDISIEDLKRGDINKEELTSYFEELGFKTLVQRI
ncbi:hypothetical protein GW950_00750 [Candidatus Wolfebacteria bacterium]|nr:hypothetical protein [Candidatus Wolfebacteria bacterium]